MTSITLEVDGVETELKKGTYEFDFKSNQTLNLKSNITNNTTWYYYPDNLSVDVLHAKSTCSFNLSEIYEKANIYVRITLPGSADYSRT